MSDSPLIPLLGHQSGWDELLLFVGLVGIVYVILRVAEKRARHKAETEGISPAKPADGSEPPADGR